MNEPQLEHGFTRIANELLDAILLAPFSKREHLVVLAVIRKTYGFNKKTDDMTMTQIASITGLARSHVGETVAGLVEKNVFLIRDGEHGKVLGISKNYRAWNFEQRTETGSSQNRNVPKTGTTCSQNGKSEFPKREIVVPESGHTKDNPKRQLQKTTPKDRHAKRQLPADFTLTPEREAFGNRIAPHVVMADEFAQFCDFHRSRGNAMLDWDAAWRTWCRNAKKFQKGVRNVRDESPLEKLQRAYQAEFGAA